jgi:hypothetical protein
MHLVDKYIRGGLIAQSFEKRINFIFIVKKNIFLYFYDYLERQWISI